MSKEEKVYKNRVMFLRVSEKKDHLYAFDREGILGEGVESILMNVSEVQALIDGKLSWVKVSAMDKVAEDSAKEEKKGQLVPSRRK